MKLAKKAGKQKSWISSVVSSMAFSDSLTLLKFSGKYRIGTYTSYKYVFDMLLLCIDLQFNAYLDCVKSEASKSVLSSLCTNASLGGAVYEEMEVKKAEIIQHGK